MEESVSRIFRVKDLQCANLDIVARRNGDGRRPSVGYDRAQVTICHFHEYLMQIFKSENRNFFCANEYIRLKYGLL